MTDIPEDIKEAFRKSRSDDIIERIVGWGRLERAGLAKSYVVGGRFLHLSLNEQGVRLRELCE